MYPLPDPRLTLLPLANHRARDLPQRPPPDEVLDRLLQAFWRGELVADFVNADGSRRDARRASLETVRRFPSHPGLLFVESMAHAPPGSVEHADGSVDVDTRIRVALPAAPEGRTEAALRSAYDALATAVFDDFCDEVKSILVALAVERADFAAYCEAQGHPLPGFWFKRQAAVTPARAAAGARRWLEREAATGVKRLSKRGYMEEAQRRFPGLSARSFDAGWADVTPPSWKWSGRPPLRVRRTPGCRTGD